MKTKLKTLWKLLEKYFKQLLTPEQEEQEGQEGQEPVQPDTPDTPDTTTPGQETAPQLKLKAWNECTKSSNWHGDNASQRMMNIVSPKMDDKMFNERLKFIKSRGCNCVHLILCNKGDGEKSGYCIYGSSFDWSIDKAYAAKMLERIKTLYNHGFGIVLWLTTDDSNDWNSKIISNPTRYVNDLDSLGFFQLASTVVIALEADEYWKSSSQISSMYKAVKAKYNGKVGVHQKSGEYGYMKLVDLAFVQLNPGTSTDKIKSFVKTVKSKTGKPVCMFELERSEDRSRCNAAFEAGAYAVGNW